MNLMPDSPRANLRLISLGARRALAALFAPMHPANQIRESVISQMIDTFCDIPPILSHFVWRTSMVFGRHNGEGCGRRDVPLPVWFNVLRFYRLFHTFTPNVVNHHDNPVC